MRQGLSGSDEVGALEGCEKGERGGRNGGGYTTLPFLNQVETGAGLGLELGKKTLCF